MPRIRSDGRRAIRVNGSNLSLNQKTEQNVEQERKSSA